jgi:hypothetical protein
MQARCLSAVPADSILIEGSTPVLSFSILPRALLPCSSVLDIADIRRYV